MDAFIQCGGRSRRMGRNKAQLVLGDTTVLGRVIAAARAVSDRVVLVTSDPEAYVSYGLEMVPDRWPGEGPLGGIGTALTHALTARVLVLACDVPLVTPELLGYLMERAEGTDVVVCETEAEGLHPLIAVYSRLCLPAIERRIAGGERKVVSFFPDVAVTRIGEAELRARGFDPAELANVNTPEEYAAMKARLEEVKDR